MKLLILSLLFLGMFPPPVFAQTASPSATPSPSPQVQGVYDDPFATEYSDTTATRSTATATTAAKPATPAATPRLVKTMSTANAPVSGAVENTIILLGGGMFLIYLGIKYSHD